MLSLITDVMNNCTLHAIRTPMILSAHQSNSQHCN